MWSRILNSATVRPSGVVPPITADRIKAFVLDAFFITLLQTPFYALVFSLANKGLASAELLYLLSYLGIPLIYFAGFWLGGLSTPGKKLMGMMVVNAATLGRVSWLQAIIRVCAYLLLPISIFRVLINPRLRLLHDEIADTQVVYKSA